MEQTTIPVIPRPRSSEGRSRSTPGCSYRRPNATDAASGVSRSLAFAGPPPVHPRRLVGEGARSARRRGERRQQQGQQGQQQPPQGQRRRLPSRRIPTPPSPNRSGSNVPTAATCSAPIAMPTSTRRCTTVPAVFALRLWEGTNRKPIDMMGAAGIALHMPVVCCNCYPPYATLYYPTLAS